MSSSSDKDLIKEITAKLKNEKEAIEKLKEERIKRLSEELKDPHAILAKDAKVDYYRTKNNTLIRVEGIKENSKGQVEVYLCELQKYCLISENSVLYSNIGSLKENLEQKTIENQIINRNKNNGKSKRIKGESRTAYIDDLLKQGKEIEEIVKLAKEKFTTVNEIQLKRLAWSRRAVFNKKNNKGKEE